VLAEENALRGLVLSLRRIRQQAHDLGDRGGMILGLAHAVLALESEQRQVAAQGDEGTVHQEPGAVPGGVGDDFAAPDTNEEVVEFVVERARLDVAGGGGECRPGLAELAGLGFFVYGGCARLGEVGEYVGIGGVPKHAGKCEPRD